MKLSSIPAKVWFGGAAALVAAVAAAQIDGRYVAAQEPAEPAGPPPVAATPLDGALSVSADTLKDLEVMRRVLLREALGARPSDARYALYGVAAQNVAYSGWASAGDAIVVPGHGALFLLRTADPVAPASGPGRAAGEAPASAWDEEAAALSAGSAPGEVKWRADGTVRQVLLSGSAGYDAAKVGALRDRAIEQLALYGSRIRGLAPTDRVSIVISGGPATSATAAVAPADGASPGAVDTRPAARPDSAPEAARRRAADAQAAAIVAVRWSQSWTIGSGPATTLTISVSVADCDAAAKGTMSREEFRRRAVVSQY